MVVKTDKKAEKDTTDIAETIQKLVDKGHEALAKMDDFDQKRIDHIVHEMAMAALDQHMELAKLAVEETGRGVYEDKF